MNLELQPFGEESHHRDADPVQAAGHLVGVVVELSAGVQLGHDDFGRRASFLFVDVDRDAAAIVLDRHRIVRVNGDGDAIRIAGQGLVDGVIDHLVDHVMQAGGVIGVADVHARPLANGVQSLEDLDVFGSVVFGH